MDWVELILGVAAGLFALLWLLGVLALAAADRLDARRFAEAALGEPNTKTEIGCSGLNFS